MLIRRLTSSQKPTQTKGNSIGWRCVLTSLSTYLTDANYSAGFLLCLGGENGVVVAEFKGCSTAARDRIYLLD